MPGDPLQKVSPGDPLRIRASTFNTFIDTARVVQRMQRTGGGPLEGQPRSTGIVKVRNSSGSAVEQFGVLGIDGVVFDPGTPAKLPQFKSEVVLDGVTPTIAEHAGKFVVLMEPLAMGAIGRGYVSGACPAIVDVVDESHEFADVKDGDATKLQSAVSGAARIIYKASGTGTKWANVLIGIWPAPDGSTTTIGSFAETETAIATAMEEARDTTVEDTRLVRVAYNHLGDRKFYGYYKTYTYVCGILVSVSGETRVEIDATEVCS